MSEFTHIVRFQEITPHEVRVEAESNMDAIGIARRLAETLAPTVRKRTFVTADTRYDQFEVEALTKRFRVSVETHALYELDINAGGREEAVRKAEQCWNDSLENFELQDFMDTRFDAEEVTS